jgi:predicted CopG family antitoxin
MGYKTISLSDEAYKKLSALKREGESFTSVILRLCFTSTKKPLKSFAGSWDMCEEEEKEIFGLLSELWKSMNKVCLNTDSLVALFRNNPDAVKELRSMI